VAEVFGWSVEGGRKWANHNLF